MTTKLLFFAQSANWMKHKSMEIKLQETHTVLEIIRLHPSLEPIREHMKSLRVAVNQEFADFSTEVHNGDEIAFLPPVSGG